MLIRSEELPALRRLGLNGALIPHLNAFPSRRPGDRLGRVTEIRRERAWVQHAGAGCLARLLPDALRALQQQGESLAVGDWVLLSDDASAGGAEAWIDARLPPLNQLARRDPDGHRQALVSNIDTALLVMGLDHDFNLARLDRYLVLCRAAGVPVLVVLSKVDLCRDAAARIAAVQQHLAGPSAPVVIALNGQSAADCQQLAPWLGEGQTLVLLGSSGAGKSTLTNTLAGVHQDTGGVRLDDSRGRHTTTARSLHRCPGGACIIDTPGLRGLQLDLGHGAVVAAFDDVQQLAPACRFRNCRHQDEPGCAVRASLAPGRLKSFHKLQREAQREQQGPLQKREQLAEWKRRSRVAREVDRGKRGG